MQSQQTPRRRTPPSIRRPTTSPSDCGAISAACATIIGPAPPTTEFGAQYILSGDIDVDEPTAEDKNGAPVTIVESVEIPTLSVGEAVMRLDLANGVAMMFRKPHPWRAQHGVPALGRNHRMGGSARHPAA